jgi:hypothetical protein
MYDLTVSPLAESARRLRGADISEAKHMIALIHNGQAFAAIAIDANESIHRHLITV